MRRVHDRGGAPGAGPIERSEHEYSMWEKRTDALLRCLWERGILNVDEHRRAIESIEPGAYDRKIYAPGIGMVREEALTGAPESAELVSVSG